MMKKDFWMMSIMVIMVMKMNIMELVMRRIFVLGGSSISEDIRDNNKMILNFIELNSVLCRYVVLI